MRAAFFCAIGGLLLLAAATQTIAQQAPADPYLPQGEGRDKVVAVCTSCHSSRTFGQLRYAAPGWRYHVKEMILHGAQIRPEDVDPIVNYLSTALGPGVPLPGDAPREVTLPDGQGKELVEGGCVLCHGLDRITAARRTPSEWNRIVDKMVFYGAPLSDDDAKAAEAYLIRNFGKK